MAFVVDIICNGLGLQDILREKMQRKDNPMIRIGQLKLSPNHTEQDLYQKIIKTLRISEKELPPGACRYRYNRHDRQRTGGNHAEA